jgi:DNA polymerase-3 subunit gamma/tau
MPAAAEPPAPYRVLARKYRPRDFADVIGQEAMVRTLTNAMAAGRLAHAFMLTGVRGVGKTTTARIIARALNCIGPDGKAARRRNPAAMRQLHRHRRGPPSRRHRNGRGEPLQGRGDARAA